MAQTVVIIPGHTEYTLPGAKTVDQVLAYFQGEVPGLAAYEATRTEDADGDITVTFAQRTGTKGALE